MPKLKKIIQNYQIIDTLEQYQSQYSILLAQHTTDQKYYVLKKLAIKDGHNEALYSVLLNEASLLKIFRHQSIITCYRMLKTPANLYIVYSHIEGNSLEQILQLGPKALSFAQKQSIAKQLCLVISELQKNAVAHLNITPANILIGKKMTLMLRQFIYAMEIPEEGQIDVKRKIPKSQFVAPEVRRGIACFQGDIYSFGRILEQLQFKKSKKDNSITDNNKRIQELETMVEGMVVKDRHQRWTLTDVYQCIFTKLKKVKRMRSLSQSSFQSSRFSQMSTTKSRIGSQKLYEQILAKIMKQRSMSWLLVKIFRTVTVLIRLNNQLTVILGILLLKKSTKLLANLGKYLHYGKNDIQIDINAKDQAKFFKTQDYFKLCELIDRQVGFQRKQFQSAAETIFVSNNNLLKNTDLGKQMKEEQINPAYLSRCIKDYLSIIMKKETVLNQLKDDWISDLVTLSCIAASKTFENFFKTNINGDMVNLDQQPFFKILKDLPRQEKLDIIGKNIFSSQNKPQQSGNKSVNTLIQI